jgi:polar amino acid transport system permease protein
MDADLILSALPELAGAALLTLNLTLVALCLSTVLALPLAVLRVDGRPAIRSAIGAYCYVIRGTPLLVQIFLIYYGLAQIGWLRGTWLWPLLREPYWCAVIALTINATAYLIEVLAGAIRALPKGEREAGKSLGLSRLQVDVLIILPRVVRLVLPNYGNEIVLLLKATSLASTITLLDLTGAARIIVARTYAPYEIFLAAAMFYLLIALVAGWLVTMLERRLRIPA